jgi:putative endonuclease
MKEYYVYILLCSDQFYYTGITNDLERRMHEHHTGFNLKCYTYDRRPVELVFIEIFNSPQEAIEFEKKIKGWSRKKKQAIINNNWEKLKELSICKNFTSHSNNDSSE